MWLVGRSRLVTSRHVWSRLVTSGRSVTSPLVWSVGHVSSGRSVGHIWSVGRSHLVRSVGHVCSHASARYPPLSSFIITTSSECSRKVRPRARARAIERIPFRRHYRYIISRRRRGSVARVRRCSFVVRRARRSRRPRPSLNPTRSW